jgi:hypothetical protein
VAEDGLVFIKGQKVVINYDIEELFALADFEQSYLRPPADLRVRRLSPPWRPSSSAA